jgi:hypothetical protein
MLSWGGSMEAVMVVIGVVAVGLVSAGLSAI